MSYETFWDISSMNADTWMIENISSVLSLGDGQLNSHAEDPKAEFLS